MLSHMYQSMGRGIPFIRSGKMADGKEKVTKQFIQSRLDDHEADLSACGISTFPTKELVSRSPRITLPCTGGRAGDV